MIHNVHKSVLMNESGRCPGTAVGRAAQGAMDSSRQFLLPPRGEKVTAGRMRGVNRSSALRFQGSTSTSARMHPAAPANCALTPALSRSKAGAVDRMLFRGRGGTHAALPLACCRIAICRSAPVRAVANPLQAFRNTVVVSPLPSPHDCGACVGSRSYSKGDASGQNEAGHLPPVNEPDANACCPAHSPVHAWSVHAGVSGSPRAGSQRSSRHPSRVLLPSAEN